MKTDTLELTIVKGHTGKDNGTANKKATLKLDPAPVKNGLKPACSYVNAELCGCDPQEGVTGSWGTLLLENPKGNMITNVQQIKEQVWLRIKCSVFIKNWKRANFGWYCHNFLAVSF